VEKYVHSRWPHQVMTHHAALWLKENAPACGEEELVLVHGDFRFGNWIFQGEKLAAVLDWERAAVGDPMQDLGFLCMPLARQRRPDLMGMLLPFDELSLRYHAATGREVDRKRLHYWVIYWQFVEAALVARALAFAVEAAESGVQELRSVTATPQLATNTRQLAQLIDDYEAGSHDL
jgi:aminoglycoside phosphotransferase (APT) family kinase protein